MSYKETIRKCPLMYGSKCTRIECEWWRGDDERCVIWGLMDIVNILADFMDYKENEAKGGLP